MTAAEALAAAQALAHRAVFDTAATAADRAAWEALARRIATAETIRLD